MKKKVFTKKNLKEVIYKCPLETFDNYLIVALDYEKRDIFYDFRMSEEALALALYMLTGSGDEHIAEVSDVAEAIMENAIPE